jgi:hypothetical protein
MRTLHLDLSNYDADAVYRLNAIGSQSNYAELQPHDDASGDPFATPTPRS